MLKKILRNKRIRRLLLALTSILSMINKVTPHKKNVILFYDGTSPTLRDNSEALYTYLLKNGYDSKYKIYFCIPNCKKKYIRKSRNLSAIGGIFKYMRAKYVFFTFGDMRIKPSKSQMVVNMFHGIAFKRIGKLCTDENYQNEKLDSFTYVVATSEWFKPYVAAEFGVTEERVLINGNCRCDYLLEKKYVLDRFKELCGEYEKKIIWMPTFRVSKSGRFNDSKGFESKTGFPVFYTKKSFDELNAYCADKKTLLVIKAHNAMNMSEVAKYSNIRFMVDADIESRNVRLYQFVKDFDALITDYSSIFIDYLLIDKPICFTIDDIDNYQNGRGFIVDDPTVYMPGHKVKTVEEFFDFIDDIKNGIDEYQNDRMKINELYNGVKKNQCDNLLKQIDLKL